MEKGQKSKTPKLAEEEPTDSTPEGFEEENASLAKREEGGEMAEPEGRDAGPAVAGDIEDAEGDVIATQLGTDRYVMAAFFASGMLLAYLIGKLIHGLWSAIANKDWFSRTVPAMAAIGDDDRASYGMVIGGIIALVVVLRTYRNPEIRTWSDEVAAELAKVKWPTKKDVTNSTFVVITATTVATLYLALLDRFWAFVTSIVYGDGS